MSSKELLGDTLTPKYFSRPHIIMWHFGLSAIIVAEILITTVYHHEKESRGHFGW